MPVYAVTGASGHLGRLIVQELLARGVPAPQIAAVVRTPSKAVDLAQRGVQVREADYSRPETLDAALAGVDRLLLVSNSAAGQRVAHHTHVVEAAKAAGASRLGYTSMLLADGTINPLASEHQDTEAALLAAGVPFTLLRNGWYTENYTEQMPLYLERGDIVGAAGSGRISAATRQDYSAAAALVLLQDEQGNRSYELGGPAFDLSELAHVISEVTATQVTYRDLSVEEYAAWLQQTGLDPATAGLRRGPRRIDRPGRPRDRQPRPGPAPGPSRHPTHRRRAGSARLRRPPCIPRARARSPCRRSRQCPTNAPSQSTRCRAHQLNSPTSSASEP